MLSFRFYTLSQFARPTIRAKFEIRLQATEAICSQIKRERVFSFDTVYPLLFIIRFRKGSYYRLIGINKIKYSVFRLKAPF